MTIRTTVLLVLLIAVSPYCFAADWLNVGLFRHVRISNIHAATIEGSADTAVLRIFIHNPANQGVIEVPAYASADAAQAVAAMQTEVQTNAWLMVQDANGKKTFVRKSSIVFVQFTCATDCSAAIDLVDDAMRNQIVTDRGAVQVLQTDVSAPDFVQFGAPQANARSTAHAPNQCIALYRISVREYNEL
jgi:hypothetical protein